MSTNEAFQKAVEDSRKLTSKPSNDSLLELYAFYKVSNGDDFSKAEKPGMFDLKASSISASYDFHKRHTNTNSQAKAKYNAWKKALEEDQLTPEGAKQKYIELVEKLKVDCGYDADKAPEAVGS
ncbi:diazepam-binding inhibitor (GABA receptor acyl binding) [Fusarium heterosporum]|uniref:Diazepam-binding inhibitor (GABA receptor acyl binding) n=1 Tax=Fusarium heterosporum TaxID=42747 RepID=A0A8H5T1R2_FUSHE|nr:diazepam-binding inhibitor (GABA receptor acyl binding) [Fusarium heterosporum]